MSTSEIAAKASTIEACVRAAIAVEKARPAIFDGKGFQERG